MSYKEVSSVYFLFIFSGSSLDKIGLSISNPSSIANSKTKLLSLHFIVVSSNLFSEIPKLSCFIIFPEVEINKANKETIRLAAKYLGNVVCGIDLAGAETLYPTSDYEGLFREASLLDIPFTIHAGEAAGPESVRKALSFGACRIGHGIRAIEDPALVDLLVRNNITLEICPKSNFDTKCFSDPNQYPLRSLFDAGVPVTLNSDNRTVSDTSLRKEIAYVQKQYHFTDAEIQKMQEYAKEALFLHL